MTERETVQPQGRADEWTESEIAALSGIDARGRILPAALADAKADARRYPDLARFLDAVRDDGKPAR